MSKKKHKKDTVELENNNLEKKLEEEKMIEKIQEDLEENNSEIEKVEEKMKEPSKKSKRKWIFLLLTLLGGAGYFGKRISDDYSSQKFFKGVYINGIQAEGLTVDQVEKKIKAKVENYKVSLKFRGNQVENIDGDEFEYRYISDNHVEKLQKKQKWYNWFRGYMNKEEFSVGEDISFDEAKLEKALLALDNMSDKNQIAPKDAYIDFKDNEFVIIPEDYGKELNKTVVIENLKNAVKSGTSEIDVEGTGAYSEPKILKNTETLVKETENLNNVAKIAITLELHDKTKETLDGNIVKNWLNIDNDGKYYFDMEDLSLELKNYIKSLAKKIDTIGKERVFKSTLQGMKTVKGGAYGYQINQKSELEQLKDDIINQRVVTREPTYLMKEISTENGGIGYTYVEIDLTNQRVLFYVDGKLQVDTPCVSGTFLDKSRVTPGGTYALYYKERNRVLRGQKQPDGTYEYESPVSYWMPFNRGIGLHDATWRRAFGGKIYMRSGSHGCINLPFNKAAAIFEKIKAGIPVVVFY